MAAHGLLSCAMPRLSCGMWDLVPWPGIETGDLGARNPSHWTTREVPGIFNLRHIFLYSRHLVIVKNWLWDIYVSSEYTHRHTQSCISRICTHMHTHIHIHIQIHVHTHTGTCAHTPKRHTTGCYHYPSNRLARTLATNQGAWSAPCG